MLIPQWEQSLVPNLIKEITLHASCLPPVFLLDVNEELTRVLRHLRNGAYTAYVVAPAETVPAVVVTIAGTDAVQIPTTTASIHIHHHGTYQGVL